MYRLELIKQSNQIQLRLIRSHSIIRTWHGNFAQIIFDKVSSTIQTADIHTILLTKSQIHLLFTEITGLYQTLIFHYKIHADLIKNKIPRNCFNSAESLLLQIRMNSVHPSYEDLQTYYLNEYNNFDIPLFAHTINLLIGNNLIQSIITDDGQQYFDKNPTPHDHIYFTQEKKLVDCSKEIAEIFSQKSQCKTSKQNNRKIFYSNQELSNIFS